MKELLILLFGRLNTHGYYTWICRGTLIAAMIVIWPSMKHVAFAFNTTEVSDASGVLGWFAAVGLESGLFFIQLGIADRLRKKKNKWIIFVQILLALGILYENVYCNYIATIGGILDKPHGWTSHMLNEAMRGANPLIDDQVILNIWHFGAGLPLTSLVILIAYAIFDWNRWKENKDMNKPEREPRTKQTKVKVELKDNIKLIENPKTVAKGLNGPPVEVKIVDEPQGKPILKSQQLSAQKKNQYIYPPQK